jgi:8-oxo-dGTP pyrophosphatase MutT (NUDIX family)
LSLRADALRVLRAWSPPDPAQAALRDLYVDHIQTHNDAMWRECRAHHTASSLITDRPGRRVLLTLHSRAKLWLQTGGHCERGDASLGAAALREAGEESGIAGLRVQGQPLQLSRHEVPFCGPVQPAFHLDVQYAVTAPDWGVEVISPESDDLRWFDVDRLPTRTDETVRDLVARMRQRWSRDQSEPAW